jgi:hypothetical protein
MKFLKVPQLHEIDSKYIYTKPYFGNQGKLLIFNVLGPYLFMLLEEQRPGSDRYRVVRNAIIINLVLIENCKILTVADEFKLSG